MVIKGKTWNARRTQEKTSGTRFSCSPLTDWCQTLSPPTNHSLFLVTLPLLYWAWCPMVWNTPLTISDHVFWLPGFSCTSSLAEHETKMCPLTETSVYYQCYYHTGSRTQPGIRSWREIDYIPAEIRTLLYKEWTTSCFLLDLVFLSYFYILSFPRIDWYLAYTKQVQINWYQAKIT